MRWRWLLAVLSLALVGFGTYAFLRSPYLTVQHVRVANAQNLDTASVAALSELQGRSILDLPLDQARARLLAVPEIKSVSFQRKWPSTVIIKVEERVPTAFWSINGRDYAVDDAGYVLSTGAPSGPAPRVIEPGSTRILGPGDRVHPDALALAARLFKESPTFFGQPVKELEYKADVGVTAVFTNGMRVTFGDDRSYEYKVAVLSTLLSQLSAKGITPRDVDLRFGERVTYD